MLCVHTMCADTLCVQTRYVCCSRPSEPRRSCANTLSVQTHYVCCSHPLEPRRSCTDILCVQTFTPLGAQTIVCESQIPEAELYTAGLGSCSHSNVTVLWPVPLRIWTCFNLFFLFYKNPHLWNLIFFKRNFEYFKELLKRFGYFKENEFLKTIELLKLECFILWYCY